MSEQWKEFAKEEPGDDTDIWIVSDGKVYLKHYSHMQVYDFTHWQPATIPAPPIIKSPADLHIEQRGEYTTFKTAKMIELTFDQWCDDLRSAYNAGRDSK